MNVSRIVAVLAVAGVLLTGCRPASSPATDTTASPAATAEPLVADTTDPATAEPAETTPAPAATTPKPATTRKPAVTPTTRKPAPKPTRKPSPSPTTEPARRIVHAGAFCSPVGALGYTSKGTLMRCTLKSGEDRARWRAAA